MLRTFTATRFAAVAEAPNRDAPQVTLTVVLVVNSLAPTKLTVVAPSNDPSFSPIGIIALTLCIGPRAACASYSSLCPDGSKLYVPSHAKSGQPSGVTATFAS